MKTWVLLVIALAAAVLIAAGSPAGTVIPAKSQPHYAADGSLMRPTEYREWTYVTSGLGMNYADGGPAGTNNFSPQFTNVFVQPEAYRYFVANGKWPDKTVFALEIYSATTHGSINKAGHYQDSFTTLEAAVKDSNNPDGWAYFGFGPEGKLAKALPKEACFQCHVKNGAVENSFVQFYPTLLDVAFAKGTIKPGVDIPLNGNRLYAIASQKGWPFAWKALEEEKVKNPKSEFGSENSLNALGYRLLASGKKTDAVAVLKRVAEQNPNSVNAFDSLADAYEASGEKHLAIEASRRELELAKSSDLPADQREQFIKLATDRITKLQ